MDWFYFVRDHPDLEYDWVALSRHPNIIWEFVMHNATLPWDWGELTRHPNISIQTIIENTAFPWVYENIMDNPNLTFNDIIGYNPYIRVIDHVAYLSYGDYYLSCFAWDYARLSRNVIK
jgi:hypothetical protein